MPVAPDSHRPPGWKPRQSWDHGGKTAHERGYGARWQKLRAYVLATEPLCRECQAGGRVTPATDVDHIVRRVDGGSDDVANLQPLCRSHHIAKTMRERRRG